MPFGTVYLSSSVFGAALTEPPIMAAQYNPYHQCTRYSSLTLKNYNRISTRRICNVFVTTLAWCLYLNIILITKQKGFMCRNICEINVQISDAMGYSIVHVKLCQMNSKIDANVSHEYLVPK
jgi:hypothetical protein